MSRRAGRNSPSLDCNILHDSSLAAYKRRATADRIALAERSERTRPRACLKSAQVAVYESMSHDRVGLSMAEFTKQQKPTRITTNRGPISLNAIASPQTSQIEGRKRV